MSFFVILGRVVLLEHFDYRAKEGALVGEIGEQAKMVLSSEALVSTLIFKRKPPKKSLLKTELESRIDELWRTAQ